VRRSALAIIAAGAIVLGGAGSTAKRRIRFDPALPRLGVKLAPLPAGSGKTIAEAACLECHSTDLLCQQHLADKQWTASVEKMIRWGAEVPDRDKAALLAYLTKNFGPDNKSFHPVHTRPVGK
jgi:cytochrome c5